MQYKCLSIAGFDGSGGAGIQADLKTFSAFGCYGMTVLTALPVQNTCGVKSCYHIPLQVIEEQLSTIFDDIMPDAIKIGMLYSSDIIEMVANFLEKNVAIDVPIVLDPVMIAKSGDLLLQQNAVDALRTKLVPMSTIITPNLPEAHVLVGYHDNRAMLGDKLLQLGSKAVLLKGGHHGGNTSDDLFLEQTGSPVWLTAERIESNNTHGTGCTLSAAICALIAQKIPLREACKYAKQYLLHAICASKNLSVGKGRGPVNHFYHLWPTLEKVLNHTILDETKIFS